MAGKFVMDSIQTKVMELLEQILGSEKTVRARFPVSLLTGQNIRFDGTSSRIISLTNEFTSFSQCRQITIIGSELNDGSWSVIDSGINGDYLEVAPSPTGDVILDEQEGLPISIHGDLEVLSNDISFDGNTITSSPTTISGNDISFTAAGEILNLGGQGVMGDDISFEGTTIRSHNGLTTGQVTDDISFDAASVKSDLTPVFSQVALPDI